MFCTSFYNRSEILGFDTYMSFPASWSIFYNRSEKRRSEDGRNGGYQSMVQIAEWHDGILVVGGQTEEQANAMQ